MMNRNEVLFYALLSFLILFSRAVFSQAPAPMAASPANVSQSEPAPVASPGVPGSSQPGQAGENHKDQDLIASDAPDPSSPNSWDRIRDVFRPYSGGTAVHADQQEHGQEAGKGESKIRLPALQGILMSSDNDKVAILEDQFARPGDFCAGFEVKKINKNTVVLKREGKEFVLYVKQ